MARLLVRTLDIGYAPAPRSKGLAIAHGEQQQVLGAALDMALQLLHRHESDLARGLRWCVGVDCQ